MRVVVALDDEDDEFVVTATNALTHLGLLLLTIRGGDFYLGEVHGYRIITISPKGARSLRVLTQTTG